MDRTSSDNKRFELSNEIFERFRTLIYDQAGINLLPSKRSFMSGRLAARITKLGLSGFLEYYNFIKSSKGRLSGEVQMFVDLLTTNETYFFREPQHFDFLENNILSKIRSDDSFQIWCAASSTGEEPYTLAMILAAKLGVRRDWSILATDISKRVLETCRKANYPALRTKGISDNYIKRYLMFEGNGSMTIVPDLCAKLTFEHFNLIQSPLPRKKFNLIFCRNVLIYFDLPTKEKVVSRLTSCLAPNGYLVIGRSETLNMVETDLKLVEPSIYTH